jgi:hypothetical protein
MIEKQKPYDVFISYATEDEAYAEKVANSLKSLGFKIWYVMPKREQFLITLNVLTMQYI